MTAQEVPRIAVVDDDPEIVESLSFLLRDTGFDVVVCPPIVDVLALIRAARPALILLDVRMGRVDGIQLFRDIRADAATQTIPVIFFTATEQRVSQQIPDYRQQGASYVMKPNIGELSRTLTQVLPRPAR